MGRPYYALRVVDFAPGGLGLVNYLSRVEELEPDTPDLISNSAVFARTAFLFGYNALVSASFTIWSFSSMISQLEAIASQ